MSILERCPYFRGVHSERFHCSCMYMYKSTLICRQISQIQYPLYKHITLTTLVPCSPRAILNQLPSSTGAPANNSAAAVLGNSAWQFVITFFGSAVLGVISALFSAVVNSCVYLYIHVQSIKNDRLCAMNI